MKSDFLFRFIHAFDEGESRFCRKALEQDAQAVKNGHLALFDVLLSLPEHNKHQVAEAMKPYPAGKHLSVAKNRLYQRLLEELKRLNAQRLSASHPKKCLEEARILYRMQLLEDAMEVLIKGLNYLSQHENLSLEVSLRDLLRRVYKNMNQKNLVMARTQNEYELVMAARKLSTVSRYIQINDRMFDYLRNYRVTNTANVKKGVAELMATPEMEAIYKADSLSAQIRFYAILQMYHSHQNDLEEAVNMNLQVIKLRESDAGMIQEDPDSYHSDLANLIGLLSMLGRIDQAEEYLLKLEHITVQGRRAEVSHFRRTELQFQLFYMNQGMLNKVLDREPKVLGGLRRFGKQLAVSTHLALLYNLGVTHMLCGNHGKAKKQFDQIRSLGKPLERTDLQGISRLLRLVLLCEEEDQSTFQHFMRNSRRFFETTDRQYQLESLVYDWLIDHQRLVGKQERKQSFGHLAQMLTPIVKQGILGAEEIQIWAEAQQRGAVGQQVFLERLAASKK